MTASAPDYTVLTEPLTTADIDDDGWISGVVAIDLSDIIGRDLDATLDMLSEALIGTDLLMNVGYIVVGHDGNTLHIRVTGEAHEDWDDL